MGNKVFYGVILVLIIGFLGLAVFNRQPAKPRPGIAQKDNGRQHVQAKQYGGDQPPTSGDHAEPVPWQVYSQEIPDANVIHNMEHGGVYISYRPDLPQDQIAKLRALFTKPYSNPKFSPIKAVVAPRAANKAPIVLSSWTRSETLQSYDEAKIIDYYLANIGKSPEPFAN